MSYGTQKGGGLGGSGEITGDMDSVLRDISELKEALRLEKSKNIDDDMSSLSKREDEVPVISPVMNFKNRKTIKGHRGRILHFDWSPDKNHVMTAGQDGFALIWNAYTGQKEIVIQTTSPSVLACAYAPSTTLVACGGMEKQCSIYKVENRVWTEEKAARIGIPSKIVAQHAKYISHCAFLGSDQQLLTSSGDGTCALWDLEMKDEAVMTFKGHKMEVLGLAVHPRHPYSVFASGSCDGSTCIWDVRTGRCEIKFTNQEAGVNGVRFHPSGESVAAAGNDGGIHLYDLRADQDIKFYSKAGILFGASAVDFTRSGRVMFAGYDDYSVRAWDVMKGTHLTLWLHHQDRVSHVLLSPDGTSLGTSSWDGTLRILA